MTRVLSTLTPLKDMEHSTTKPPKWRGRHL